MNTDTFLLLVILAILVLTIGGVGIFLVWRWLNGILTRLAKLEEIANAPAQWEVPYKLRSAILDMEAPLIETLVAGKADLEAYIARANRTLQIYQDIYQGVYDPNQKAKKK